EALRRVDREHWQRVRIEFEYESRNFLDHMHDAADCDLIVCWKHNWPDCPLEVLELKSLVGRLGWAWSRKLFCRSKCLPLINTDDTDLNGEKIFRRRFTLMNADRNGG